MTQSRRPSPLQRRVLIVLAALDEKRPGPVLTRDLERVLERSGEAPVYGPNLRASCRRLEDAGWLRTLRAPNLQLAVELTDAGRAVAQPLLLAEQDRLRAEQRAAEVVVLPLVPAAGLPAGGTSATDLAVELNGITYQACRGDFVVRLDGSTCLQLWNKEGRVVRREGDPLEVAQWLQACHDAGIAVRVQINESATPEEGALNVTAPADRTDTWYRQLDVALQAEGISGLNEEIRQAVITPGEGLRDLPAPARLLQVLVPAAQGARIVQAEFFHVVQVQVGVVHAAGGVSAVADEGVSAGVVGDAGLGEVLIDGELGGHDDVRPSAVRLADLRGRVGAVRRVVEGEAFHLHGAGLDVVVANQALDDLAIDLAVLAEVQLVDRGAVGAGVDARGVAVANGGHATFLSTGRYVPDDP